MRQFKRNLVLLVLAVAVQGLFAAAQAQTTYTLGTLGWSPGTGPLTYNTTSKVASLTDNIMGGNLVITVPGVTVDGNGYLLSGSGDGISIIGGGGVTVRNFGSISGFENGILISSDSTSPMQGCTIANNFISANEGTGRGIYIATGVQGNANHTISGNFIFGFVEGVVIAGTSSTPSTGHNLFGNTIQGNTVGLHLIYVGSTSVYNNNFRGQTTQVVQEGGDGSNVFSKPLPEGGNYWSDWNPTSVTPQIDTDGDGIVNSPYPNTTPHDALPWTTANRWIGPLPNDPLVSSASVQSGTPGQNDWFTSDVVIGLSVSDPSRLRSIRYSINSLSNWQTSDAPLGVTISTDGAKTIYFYSITSEDPAILDNPEQPPKSYVVKVDKTAPTTAALLSGTLGTNGWYVSDVSVGLTGSDETSGISSTVYSFDGTTWASLPVPTIAQSRTVYFRSTDNAGNVETAKSINVQINPTITASAGPNGSISPSGTVYVNNGQNQLFTITASAGYKIADVLVDGVSVGAAASYTFTNVVAQHTISASFAVNTYTLAITATNGSVAKIPNQTDYNYGTAVQLTATPAAGYYFVNWSGDLTGSTNPVSVTMDANKTITANFAIDTYTLAVSATNGTVAKNPDLPAYNSGATVQLTATPATGYYFVNWSGDLTGSTNPVSVAMDANKTITANFASDSYTLTVSATNGTVAKNPDQPSYNAGSTVQLTATPATGYHFANWTGDVTGATNPVSVTMNGNKTVTANFAINTYTLTASAGANGTITPSGSQTVNSGTNLAFTITPNAGYDVADVLVDGASVGAVTTYTFTNVTANHTIAASFAASSTATGSAAGAGSISSPAGAYASKPAYIGKGYFAFAAGYIRNNPLPIGLTTFALKSASFLSKAAFTFTSFKYEALTFSGNQGTLVGTGKVNYSGDYGFLLSFTDGHASNTSDKLRMKIWNKNSANAVFYDSQMGAPDDASPTAAVTGGVLTITRSGESTAAMDMDVEELIAADDAAQVPTEYALYNAYPNPFNPSTTIKFDLPEASMVRLAVYDMLGREVAVLVNGERVAGQHIVVFDAGRLASGMYIYRLQTGDFTQTKKLMLMK